MPRAGDRAQRPHARRSSARRSRSGEGGKWRKQVPDIRTLALCLPYATHVATRLLSPIRLHKAGHAPAPRVARECREDAPLAPPRHEGTWGGAKRMPRGQGSPRERRASDAVTARARVVQR
eukprot:scaffold19550_cov66-Phaeocystis_antarctica.AAC.1